MTTLIGEKSRVDVIKPRINPNDQNVHGSYCVGLSTKTVAKGDCHLLSIKQIVCLDLAERTNLPTMEDGMLERALVRVHNELQLVEFCTGVQEI
jgi:hypothetical protein